MTPKNESGICINLMNCPVLLVVLEHRIKTKSADDYSLLKKSQCGFEGRTPKVCCPLDETSGDVIGLDSIEEVPSNENRTIRSTLDCGKIVISGNRIVGGKISELGENSRKTKIIDRILFTFRPN